MIKLKNIFSYYLDWEIFCMFPFTIQIMSDNETLRQRESNVTGTPSFYVTSNLVVVTNI